MWDWHRKHIRSNTEKYISPTRQRGNAHKHTRHSHLKSSSSFQAAHTGLVLIFIEITYLFPVNQVNGIHATTLHPLCLISTAMSHIVGVSSRMQHVPCDPPHSIVQKQDGDQHDVSPNPEELAPVAFETGPDPPLTPQHRVEHGTSLLIIY